MKYGIPVLLLISLMALSCAGSGKKKETEAKTPVTVGVYVASESEKQSSDNYVGLIEADKSIILSAPHIGTITSLDVKQGSVVKQGQILAEIDSKNVKTSYEISHATLKQAEDGYERVSKVYASGTVADVKMVEIETQLAKARAAAQSSAESMEECKIKAPFSGTVSEVLIDKGINVSIGTPLIKLVDISTVEISISVPESEINTIYIGQEAIIDIPALDIEGLKSKIVSKGVVASSLSHSYECILKFTEPVKGLMPGMVSKVFIIKPEVEKGILIPASAVETDINGRFVWTVKDGKVHKVYVTVDEYMGNGVKITDGIQYGDMIIIQGSAKVSTGMSVETTVVSE